MIVTVHVRIHEAQSPVNKMAARVRRETSWRRRWKPDLKSQPWKPFSVSCGTYLVKSMFVEKDCSYEFCLCDLNTLWYENVEQNQFKARAQELNPNVEAKHSYLLKIVQKNVEERNGETTFTINKDATSDDTLVLKMKTKLQAGVPFVWEFHCAAGEQSMVGSHLIQPMLAMIVELNRRESALCTILRKKDQEINDYKESGIRLSRKSLATSEFDENSFKSRMVLSQGFEDAVEHAATSGFNESSCELYKQVMIKRAWIAEKDLPEPEVEDDVPDDVYESVAEGAIAGPSVASWAEMPPPSLMGKDGTPSPRKTPVTSPAKSAGLSSPEKPSSKDLELQRREELQKRLADEAERKKRKKRKIKL